MKFTAAAPAQGNKNYIPVSDLYARNFTDTNGEFQLELSIGHVRTVYNAEIRVPTNIFGCVQWLNVSRNFENREKFFFRNIHENS